MNNIDIAVNMVEPLNKDYYKQFEVLTPNKLKPYNKKLVAFVIAQITRKIDNSTVYLIIDVVKATELASVVRNKPQMPLLYASLKNDIKEYKLSVKNGNYLDKLIEKSEHPIFSNIPCRTLNVLVQCYSTNSAISLENAMDELNEWMNDMEVNNGNKNNQ